MDRLTITRGDARQIDVTLTLNGTAWNLPVGGTLRLTGKRDRKHTDDQAVFTKTASSTTAGVATFTIDADDTDTLATNGNTQTVYCDVQAAGVGWGPWTVAEFLLIVTPDVSRTTP